MPERSARTSTGVVPSRVVTVIAGCDRRSAATARGASDAPALGYQPSRTAPARGGSPASSRSVAATRSSTAEACRSRIRPAPVSSTPSRRRSSSSTPAARSSTAIWRDTADWV
ncbi:hypothetical protein GCM10009539_31000 [Cryptosporangium japonicum]|uniref:Uncharacterized protein n=1 Tax=Cryptosporangium japonicum TaxID=80872 RepID=A0ABN0U9N7_9ACTN